jgi:hypothetical protein
MHDERSIARPIDHVRGVLDAEFRTTAAIAQRCGLTPSTAAPPLGMLRRKGEADWMAAEPGHRSMWRQSAARRAERPAPS